EVEVRCVNEAYVVGVNHQQPYNTYINSYPYYTSVTIYKGPVVQTYPWVTINYSELCPGVTYKYRIREHHQGSGTGLSVGPWSVDHFFTTPGTTPSVLASILAENTFLCEGECTGLTALGSGACGLDYTFSWSHGLGTSKSVNVCPTITTTYSV